jgi:hypothetical protein
MDNLPLLVGSAGLVSAGFISFLYAFIHLAFSFFVLNWRRLSS